MNKRPERQSKKRQLLYSIAAVVVLIIACLAYYIFVSVHAWKKVDEDITKRNDAFVSLAQTQLKNDPSGPEKAVDSLKVFYEEYNKDNKQSHCTVPYAVQWQSTLWLTKDIRNRCTEAEARQTTSLSALSTLYSYLRGANEIIAIPQVALREASTKGIDYDAAIQRLQAALEALKSHSHIKQLDALQNKASQLIQNIITAYEGVKEANKSEDRSKFDAAVTKLGQTYDTAPSLVDDARSGYAPLLEQTNTALKPFVR